MAKKPKFWAPKEEPKSEEKGEPVKPEGKAKRRLRDAYDKKKD